MNGIIHSCCHPKDKPSPENEDDMYGAVFPHLDRIFQYVSPRKLIFIAIDGVAPRAKMNQQRSRRFRSAKDQIEKKKMENKLRKAMVKQGQEVPPPTPRPWDHNVITPGTSFMEKLARLIRFYLHSRITNNPAWKNVVVLFSDAAVPGEGEHKIMKFIRLLRAQHDYDPNTTHVICGEDADLIMLSLATHESRFIILRDRQFFGQGICRICGQSGHRNNDCTNPKPPHEFQYLYISTLRSYLKYEFNCSVPGPYLKFERVIDDFVFLVFFMGNDFLPSLPGVDIRNGSLDLLIELYKKYIDKIGYLTKDGHVLLGPTKKFLSEYGKLEDNLFFLCRKAKIARECPQNTKQCIYYARNGRCRASDQCGFLHGSYCPRDQKTKQRENEIRHTIETFLRRPEREFKFQANFSSFDRKIAHALSTKLSLGHESRGEGPNRRLVIWKTDRAEEKDKASRLIASSFLDQLKEKLSEKETNDYQNLDDGVVDSFGTPGWRDRYYNIKFRNQGGIKVVTKLVNTYMEGLCWIFRYYYDGCAAWDWQIPFHYAPFASDLAACTITEYNFNLGKPFTPIAQLMAVLPPYSAHCLPRACQNLMKNINSPIRDLYPMDFRMDPNGKNMSWQWICLLPFLNEEKMVKALRSVEHSFTEAEHQRNANTTPWLLCHESHPLVKYVKTKGLSLSVRECGIAGEISSSKTLVTGELPTPDPTRYKSIGPRTRTFEVEYIFPQDRKHRCELLRGATSHPNVPKVPFAQIQDHARRYKPKTCISKVENARRVTTHHFRGRGRGRGPERGRHNQYSRERRRWDGRGQ